MKRIGLLGGTFNYAHHGHLYISRIAIKKLNLTEIWWLVCESNPFKKHDNVVNRVLYARNLIGFFPKIKVVSINDFRTYNYIVSLKRKFKENDFIWIMGMDNFINFHTWDNVYKINSLVPIVIFDRDNLLYKGIKSPFAMKNIKNFSGVNFYNKDWFILRVAKNNLSSTLLQHKMR